MAAAHFGDGSEEEPSGRTALPIRLGAVVARDRFEIAWGPFISFDYRRGVWQRHRAYTLDAYLGRFDLA